LRIASIAAGLCVLIAAAPPAMAGSGDGWRVSGTISGRTFLLDCRLEQPGAACIDASNRSRSHPLTSLAVSGTSAQWGFTTTVLLAKIAMRFNARIEGNRMSGEVTAAGRKGTFTGIRN
jgi:hypothetical protein